MNEGYAMGLFYKDFMRCVVGDALDNCFAFAVDFNTLQRFHTVWERTNNKLLSL